MKRNSTAYSVPVAYDNKDCSVRAVSVAAGCSYAQASAIFSAAGRKLKRGTNVLTSRIVHEDWLKMEYVPDCTDLTVAEFLVWYPRGSFVVHRVGHAFAVVDGVLHDWERGTGERTKVVRAWKVTQETRAKIERTKDLFG